MESTFEQTRKNVGEERERVGVRAVHVGPGRAVVQVGARGLKVRIRVSLSSTAGSKQKHSLVLVPADEERHHSVVAPQVPLFL